MSKKSEKRPKSGRSHNDGLTYFERYQKEARNSASIDRFTFFLDANGFVQEATCGGESLPDRETMIQREMKTEREIVVGSWPNIERFRYHPSREEAEQMMELVFGEVPTRILCSAGSPKLPKVPQQAAA